MADSACEGVLFHPNRGCFPKTNLNVLRCGLDGELVLFARRDLNRPPSAPEVVPSGMLTSAKCSAAMRDVDHKFYAIWGEFAWTRRWPGQDACWGDGTWFERVAAAEDCDRGDYYWGNTIRGAASVLGFGYTMQDFCNRQAGLDDDEYIWDLREACTAANLNILRVGFWDMCINVEWAICIIRGDDAGGDRSLLFTFPPGSLDTSDYSNDLYTITEDDIYYLEVCTLNEMCENYEEIFTTQLDERFICKFDAARWEAFGREMRELR